MGDAGLPQPLPLAAQGLLARDVGVGHAAVRRGEEDPLRSRGDVHRPQDAGEAALLGVEVGQERAVGREGDLSGDDGAGAGEAGDEVEREIRHQGTSLMESLPANQWRALPRYTLEGSERAHEFAWSGGGWGDLIRGAGGGN